MPAVLESLLGGLDAEARARGPRSANGRPVEIVCHLRDEETEDFGARLRVILSGADELRAASTPSAGPKSGATARRASR